MIKTYTISLLDTQMDSIDKILKAYNDMMYACMTPDQPLDTDVVLTINSIIHFRNQIRQHGLSTQDPT